MHPTTKTKALAALDGMREIVRNEMIVRQNYITDVVDPAKAEAGAVCGGREACAVGSLWLAGGVKVEETKWGEPMLPGVDRSERPAFLRHRHGLRAAYDALNAASQKYADKHNINLDEHSYLGARNGAMEQLFEHNEDVDSAALSREDLLRIISTAKRAITAA